MADSVTTPRIIGLLMDAAHKLASVDADKERLCYLVSDQEWREIVKYVGRFEYREWMPDERVKTMNFAGIEVIKRSALNGRGGA